MSDLETRSIELRADTETGIVEGRAVPFGESAVIGSYTEMFAKGSVEPRDDIKLFYSHNEIIGRVLESESREDGFYIKAKISDTALGRDALTLLRDGALSKFSVGFVPLESETDDDGVVVRTKVDIREVSLVAMPAYSSADIQHVRASNSETEEIIVTDQVTSSDLDEVRDEFDRKLATVQVVAPAPAVDHRSAGQVLKAIATGDERSIRAYNGMTTDDAITNNAWVGSLVRLIDEASTLRSVFATGPLPAEGNYFEYGVLDSNTIQVAEQAHEGDDLVFGKVGISTESARVRTYGGWTQISRQAIERTSVGILDLALQAQAIEMGKQFNTVVRNTYLAAHAAQLTGNSVTIPASAKGMDWVSAVVDAKVLFNNSGLALDYLVVDLATYKSLFNLSDTTGRPLFNVSGQAVNSLGDVNPAALTGNLAGVTVVVDAGLASGKSAFVNRNSIRFRSSGVVRLQDENIINLTKDFSLYAYAGVATEIPAGIVPVKAAA